jgi:hypothetical protein
LALAHTAALTAKAAHSPHCRRAVVDLIRRFPAALANRLPPDPHIEGHLRIRDRADDA